jgi:hypothetical protein
MQFCTWGLIFQKKFIKKKLIFQKKIFFLVENFCLILMGHLITLYISRYLSNFNYQFYKVPILVKKKFLKKICLTLFEIKIEPSDLEKKKYFFLKFRRILYRTVYRTIEWYSVLSNGGVPMHFRIGLMYKTAFLRSPRYILLYFEKFTIWIRMSE